MQLSTCHFKWWWRLRQLWNIWIFQTFPHWTKLLFSKSRNVWWNYSISQFPAMRSSQFWSTRVWVLTRTWIIEACELEFSAEECTKTFDSVGSSRLQIEPKEGHNPLNVVNTFKHILFEWELLFSGSLLKNLYICDPPQDFQHNGDNTGTPAMTRHAKRDIWQAYAHI